MKVIVSNPPWPGKGYGCRTNVRWPHRRGDKVFAYPIYLAYAISFLKRDGFEARGIDAAQQGMGIYSFVNEVKKYAPKVILLEISAPSLHYDLETAELLKKEMPDLFIALCGPHCSYAHKELVGNYSFVDAAIRQEFELTFLDLCKAIRDNTDISKIDGLTFRKNGSAIVNKPRGFSMDIDSWPFPDREEFKIENYQQAFYGGRKNATMIASKGCPYRCNFCVWPQTMGGHEYRTRSPKNIVDEIMMLKEKYGIDEVFFDDDTFAINKDRMIDISKEMILRNIGIPWLCMGRVNTVDDETAAVMAKAGCTQIFFGFESGSQDMLNDMKKGTTTAQAFKAVRACQKVGMAATGSFMFGLPNETYESAMQTIKFAKKLKADFVQFTRAAPFPGTEFYELAKKEGLLEMDSLADLDGTKGTIIHTRFMTKNELDGIQRKAYVGYYTSPGVIWQNVKMAKNPRDVRRIARGAVSVMSRILFYKE